MTTAVADHITCRELVELVTDYVEGAMTAQDRARFEAHLEGCDACTAYIEQMRATILVAGRITEDALDPSERDALLHAFRDWKDGGPPKKRWWRRRR